MSTQDQRQTACILLAAGESKRMGRNKLLLPLSEHSIIEITMRELMPFPFLEKIIVVAPDSAISHLAPQFGFRSIVNADFQKGIHSSIRKGMETVSADFYLIALGDQPLLSQRDYLSFFTECENQKKSGKKLFRPFVNGVPGNPCLIHNDFKNEIFCRADTDKGCQYLFQNHKDLVHLYESSNPSFVKDIDTQQDYQACAI